MSLTTSQETVSGSFLLYFQAFYKINSDAILKRKTLVRSSFLFINFKKFIFKILNSTTVYDLTEVITKLNNNLEL